MRQCRKRRYPSEWAARADQNVLAPKLGDFTMEPYLCKCGWWHNGHASPEIKRREKRLQVIAWRLAVIGLIPGTLSRKIRAERRDLLNEQRQLLAMRTSGALVTAAAILTPSDQESSASTDHLNGVMRKGNEVRDV